MLNEEIKLSRMKFFERHIYVYATNKIVIEDLVGDFSYANVDVYCW